MFLYRLEMPGSMPLMTTSAAPTLEGEMRQQHSGIYCVLGHSSYGIHYIYSTIVVLYPVTSV